MEAVETMKRMIPVAAVVMTLVVFGGVACQQSSDMEAPAQTIETPATGVPTFRVDPDWPDVPDEWKLGDVSSIASMQRTMCGCCIGHGRCPPMRP